MRESSRWDRGSFMVPLGFILLGIFALWGTRDMSELGSVFPRTIGSAMILFSAIDIVWRWLRPRHDGQPLVGSTPRRLLLVAIMLLWAVLLQQIGFFVTSAAASLLLLRVAHHEPWTRTRAIGYALSTLAVVGGLYTVFAFGLQVPLPSGVLF